MIVEVERPADLLDPAQTQHDDPVGHGHGLDLVVGDVDHGVAEPAVQAGKLHPHLDAELGVEVRERLVEKKDAGLAHDGAPDRHPLALAARELPRPPRQQRLDLQHPGRLGDAPLDLGLGRADVLEPEGEIVPHRHVGIERVGLEDHGEAAPCRRQLVGPLAVDADLAAADLFEPGDHPQERGLAAARGAHEHAELALLDPEVDAVDDLGVAVALLDVIELEGRHGGSPAVRIGVDQDGRAVAAHLMPVLAMPVVMWRCR